MNIQYSGGGVLLIVITIFGWEGLWVWVGYDLNGYTHYQLGFTPLMKAAHGGHTACLRVLLRHTADPNLTAKVVLVDSSRKPSIDSLLCCGLQDTNANSTLRQHH